MPWCICAGTLDYDAWARDFDLATNGRSTTFSYFKSTETSDCGASAYRGGEGRLQVTKGNMDNPLFEALMLAGDQSGQGTSDDLNGYKPEGIARLDRTATPDGRRCSAADAHLMLALVGSSSSDHPNLELVTGAAVDRIVMDSSTGSSEDDSSLRAVGVKLRGGAVIRASESVLICAGAIKSPQLLMLSGIGPRKHLEDVGVTCRHNLPGVGQNLQDHACIVTAYHSTPATVHHSLSHLSRPLHKLMAGAQWLLDGTGHAASNIWEGGGLVYGRQYAEQLGKDGGGALKGGRSSNSSSSSSSSTSDSINLDSGSGPLPAPNLQFKFCPVFSEYSG